MKFTIEIDPEINPDAVGEYLRSAFFDEKEATLGDHPHGAYGEETYRETGCYNTFDWQKDVEPLEEIRQEESTCEGCQKSTPHKTQGGKNSMDYVCTCTYEACWTRGKKQVGLSHVAEQLRSERVEIECRYYWDGDGTLVFILPEGQYLVNSDCKKDHGWYLTEDPEDF